MGFWSKTSKVLSSSGRAISNGMDLLVEGAAELERISDKFLLETTIKTLELKRERLGEEWFSPENSENHEKLLDSYHQCLQTNSPHHSSDAQAKLDKLYADQRSLEISENLKSVKSLTSRLESSQFRLAIDAINARRALISKLDELIKLHSSDLRSPISDQAKSKKLRLKKEIADLEPARRTTHITFHDSGLPKSSAVRFDGKLHETYETWHENGSIKWRIPFDTGEPFGIAKRCRDNGSPLLTLAFDKRLLSVTVSSSHAEPLAYVKFGNEILHVELLPQELRGIKLKHVPGKRVSKLYLAAKILPSFKALKFIWNARKSGRERELMRDFNIAADELQSGMAELTSILGTTQKNTSKHLR